MKKHSYVVLILLKITIIVINLLASNVIVNKECFLLKVNYFVCANIYLKTLYDCVLSDFMDVYNNITDICFVLECLGNYIMIKNFVFILNFVKALSIYYSTFRGLIIFLKKENVKKVDLRHIKENYSHFVYSYSLTFR